MSIGEDTSHYLESGGGDLDGLSYGVVIYIGRFRYI